MILVVAEKPSVGRDLARVLGCSQMVDGALVGAEYAVCWAVGHLVGLKEPGEVNPAWQAWRASDLPMLPEEIGLKVIRGQSKPFAVIKKWMKNKEVTEIICATDAGREGELIFRFIYQMAGCKKPCKRLWISSMTASAIREGFEHLAPSEQYDNLYKSALCRSQADWLVGMNGSRAYSLRYNAHLSVGRVQTPTLAFLVRRQQEIDAFVPQDYFVVTADFGAYTSIWITPEHPDGKHPDEAAARQARERALGQTGRVASVETKPQSTPPPLLMDLTTLQREANRRLGLTAKRTLDAAQALYEKHKAITYPRTDSRFLTPDLIPTLPARLQAAGAAQPYHDFIAPLMALDKLPISGRIINEKKVHDHFAIIPTEKRLPAAATAEERAVYDLVARAFIAAFYPPERAEQTTVHTQVGQDDYLSRGRVVLDAGWTAVWQPPKPKKGEGEEDARLPALSTGQSMPVKDARVDKKKTSPPKPYTDATLLSAMEFAGRDLEDELLREQMKDMGLGTPATRAAILERLLAMGYVRRQKKSLAPTEKGIALIAAMPDMLTQAETTAKWERALARIARGEMDPERFMASIGRFTTFLAEDARTRPTQVYFPREQRTARRASNTKKPAAAPGGSAPPRAAGTRGSAKGAPKKSTRQAKTAAFSGEAPPMESIPLPEPPPMPSAGRSKAGPGA
nr:DNA topoisomerase 3 [bacterium]